MFGLLGQEANLTGGTWSAPANFTINTAGFAIVEPFVATWAVALAAWRFGRIEARWDAAILARTPPGSAESAENYEH